MKSKFIAIEGGEGSGKSSLLAALHEVLGDRAVFTREPGGTPYAEKIRALALKDSDAKSAPGETTLCLMFAARYEHIENKIEPALQSGKIVVTDRFDASSFALNVWAQLDGKLEKLFWNLRKGLKKVPDLYVYVDVDPVEGLRRAQARNESSGNGKAYDHFDDRDVDFHKKVREGFLKFMRSKRLFVLPRIDHVIIDANRPLEEVKKDFISAIKQQIGI
jgi:dTMP kinase